MPFVQEHLSCRRLSYGKPLIETIETIIQNRARDLVANQLPKAFSKLVLEQRPPNGQKANARKRFS